MSLRADFTDLISRDANAWIAKIHSGTAKPPPFLAVLSTPACHDGTIPAPQYDDPKILNGTTRAPRTGNWNMGTADKHHFASGAAHPPMGQQEVAFSDLHFLRRLLTLQSVDDLVESLVSTLRKVEVLETTAIIYTSGEQTRLGLLCSHVFTATWLLRQITATITGNLHKCWTNATRTRRT